ncbi:MAG: gliding motility-associated C-terminal domain-containing protein [Bacteroidota bacterium]
MNTKINIFILIFLCFGVLPSIAQIFYNNGVAIQINSSIDVQINGSIENANSGNLSNDGNLYVTGNITNNALLGGNGNSYLLGDWINNNNFNPGMSHIYLNGGNQYISGTVSSTFYNLELLGTDVKNLQINTSVNNVLALNDRELATGNYVMNVLSPGINAVTRTSGFVSSTGNGNLNRATANSAAYLFPVGSSTGTLRYRPVEISPVNASVNTYSVRFVNNLATSDGYDISLTDTNTCMLNPDFYHRINRTSGTSAAGLAIFYDEIADGLWDGLAHWMTTPSNLWLDAGNITQTSGTPLNNNFVANWNNFNNDPYILSYINPVVDLGPDTFVCDNSYITLNAGSGWDSYTWSTSQTGVQSIDVTLIGTYYVTVTSMTCSAIDSIKVNLRPSPIADAGENTTICSGESVNLTGIGGTLYEWSNSQTTQTISVNPIISTTYYLTVTENYCSDTDSVTVTVIPSPVANAGTDQIICIGDSIQLIATGGSIYNWSTGENTQSIIVTPLTTTNYIVTVSDSGCDDTDTVLVTVINSITAEAGADQNICIGDNINLTASGGVDYNWSNGATTASTNVSPASTTTYYVTVSIGSCSDTDSITITAYPIPIADAGNDQTICDGQSAILTATGGVSYSWNTGANTQTTTVNPVTTTTYYVTVTENSCSATDYVTIIVNPLPIVYAGADQNVCAGDTVTLNVSAGVLYNWSNGANTSSITISPTSTTTYYVTVTDVNGCTGSDNVIVTINPIPNAFAGQDIEGCQGDTVQLQASGGTSYIWVPSVDLSNPNISNPILFPTQTIDYIVFAYNGGCSDSDTLTVNYHWAPYVVISDTAIYRGDNAYLHTQYSSDYIYSWTPADSLNNPFIYNPVATPYKDISYYVEVADQYGCHNTGIFFVDVMERPAGDLIIYNTFTPNNDGYNDVWIIENIEQYPGNYIEVYNRNGHIVFEAKDYENNWDGKYYGSNLPAATYYYLIDLGDDSDIIKGDVTIIR